MSYRRKYKATGVINLLTGQYVAEGTPEWQTYLDWVALGNQPLPVLVTYRLPAAGDGIIRLEDTTRVCAVSIPNDIRNADWREYQAWLGAGNTPLPAITVRRPPEERSMYPTHREVHKAVIRAILQSNTADLQAIATRIQTAEQEP
jgi:hypothetical protein